MATHGAGGDFTSGGIAFVAQETHLLANRLTVLCQQVVKWVTVHPVPLTGGGR